MKGKQNMDSQFGIKYEITVKRYEYIRDVKKWLKDSPIETYMDDDEIDNIDFSEFPTKRIKEFLDKLGQFKHDHLCLRNMLLDMSCGKDFVINFS